jgi:hypothetical protein
MKISSRMNKKTKALIFSNRPRSSNLSAFHPILLKNKNSLTKLSRRSYPPNNATKQDGTKR